MRLGWPLDFRLLHIPTHCSLAITKTEISLALLANSMRTEPLQTPTKAQLLPAENYYDD
jgi:hypothetical protein